MCAPGSLYECEQEWLDFWEQEDKKNTDKTFYNKNSVDWDYYSGLPNPKFYESK